MGEIIELLKNMEMQIKELSAILDCKNGTIASLAKVRDELKEENKELKEKLEKIKEIAETALKANYCNNCDGVGLPECLDTECHTYALDKIMDVIEGAEDEND